MRYIACVVADIVASVVVADDTDTLAYIGEINNADEVVDVTDYAQRPGPGWTWVSDTFRPPPPFSTWVWEDDTWQAPLPYPDEPGPWVWNDDAISWDRPASYGQ
jgi:hypothetical protein